MSGIGQALRTGVSFGLTSGVITTLGLIVGLYSSTGSRSVVVGGILIIAVADALSDALGIHLSEEAENVHTEGQIWASTLATLVSKFMISLTFLVPVFLFSLTAGIVASAIWGLVVVAALSWLIARLQKKRPLRVIVEHAVIAVVVVAASHFVGEWVGERFG